jgi:hypothetical protein
MSYHSEEQDYTDPARVTTPMKEWWKQVDGLTGAEVCTKAGKPKRFKRSDLREGELTMLMVQGLKNGGLPPGLKKKGGSTYRSDSSRSDVSDAISQARQAMASRTPKKSHPVPMLKIEE